MLIRTSRVNPVDFAPGFDPDDHVVKGEGGCKPVRNSAAVGGLDQDRRCAETQVAVDRAQEISFVFAIAKSAFEDSRRLSGAM